MKSYWAFLPLLFVFDASAFAATYTLDPNGSDSASGSPTAPWRTLSYACGKVASGDTIYINPGHYFDPNRCNLKIGVKIQGAGKSLVTITSQYVGSTSDAYIFRNSPSTIPVTHGNNEISGFTLDGNNKSLNAGIRLYGTDALSIHDLRFQSIKLHAILIGGWDGWPNYDAATTTPPAAYGRNVVIHDIETNDTTQDDYSGSLPGAIHLQALQGAQVYNLTINENFPSRGVGVKAVPGWLHSLNGTNWNIKTNLADGDAFVFEMYNFEGDSEIHHSNFNHLISLNGGPQALGSGSSWNLRIHDTVTDFTGLTQGTTGHELSHNHLDFYNNFVSNNKGVCAGLWTTNYLTATSVTNWRFRNNVLYNCGDGLLISRGSLSGISIVNNVFDTVTATPWGGYGVEAAGGSASGMRIQNNVCLKCASGLARFGSGFSNTIMDHNWVGTANPGFSASGTRPSPYYQPVFATGSLLIDKGINVGLPYSGAAPDVGAFEYNPVPPPPSAFAITANAGANGSILPSGTVSVASGASRAFTITPSEGYYVQSVLVDGAEVASDIPGGAPFTYTLSNVTSDHAISAVFDIRHFHIVGSAGAGGTVSVADLWIPYNSSQTVSIVPGSGYQIQDVKVDGTSIGAVASYTFSNIKADHTIAAVFAIAPPPSYTISASAGSNGSISPSGNVAVTGGQGKTFTITPNTGYYVASVTVDGAVVASNIPEGGTTYTFANVTGNHSISASFLMRSYHLISMAGTGGSVSPADVWIPYNGSQTVWIAPSAGYQVQDVKVDGVSVGAVRSFTFSNIAANHTLSATFGPTPPVQNYTITASAGSYGSITPSGSVTVAAGVSKTFTITPSRRYRVLTVLVDGVSVGAVTSYTFRSVLANHRIEARFIRR